MKILHIIILTILCPGLLFGQKLHLLNLPNQEQLSSNNILYLMQDSEGSLWYATEGGGLCRDNGLQVDVFRSDSKAPDLLGSNNISYLAEYGQKLIIGTFHGAYILDKKDFSIRRIVEVDDKRVDDILVTHDNRLFLTSNKKILEFNEKMQLVATFPSRYQNRDVYVSHLYEDRTGIIWATQWDGGLLKKEPSDSTFISAMWTMEIAPTDVADDHSTGMLWVGTIGQGIVRYNPKDGTIERQPAISNSVCIDLQLSKDKKRLWTTTTHDLLLFQIDHELQPIEISHLLPNEQKVLNRLSLDLHGNLLIAGHSPAPVAITSDTISKWFDNTIKDGTVSWENRERQGLIMEDLITHQEKRIVSDYLHSALVIGKRKGSEGIWIIDGQQLLACNKDTIYSFATLPVHPVTFTDDGKGHLWLSTGSNIRRFSLSTQQEDSVMANVKDVAALTVDNNGKLWMGTIFGKLLCLDNGELLVDEYASNEFGDGITHLFTDSIGRIVIVCDHYVRLYDVERHTLRQQTRETGHTYLIELQETEPNARWSHPEVKLQMIERIPQWLTSWWMLVIYAVFLIALISLLVHYYILKRQRKQFLELMKKFEDATPVKHETEHKEHTEEKQTSDLQSTGVNEWLNKAIAQVEKNLSNEDYTVEQLSNDLCMSRMTFYRKIQSLTGQKPTEFIRTIRLRRAAKLLSERQFTITEISYATGFSSVSYFSRCFRTMFGVPPTQFMGSNDLAERDKTTTLG